MRAESDRAREALRDLPDSPERARALKALNEIDRGDREIIEQLEKMERVLDKARLTPREIRLYKILPWIALMIGAYAIYVGVDAILSSEMCSRRRSGVISCYRGLGAQFAGGTMLAIGLLIAMVPLPSGRAKSAIMALVGSLGFAALIGHLIVIRN